METMARAVALRAGTRMEQMTCKRCLRFERIKKKGMLPSQLDYTNMPAHDDDCRWRKR